MARATIETDMDLGIAISLGIVTIMASGVLYVSEGLSGAYGFGAAVLTASLLVVMLHVFDARQ
ncbi:MAG: hypothetical protein ABEJ58_10280 [Halodesulfurarchaeum sp.]